MDINEAKKNFYHIMELIDACNDAMNHNTGKVVDQLSLAKIHLVAAANTVLSDIGAEVITYSAGVFIAPDGVELGEVFEESQDYLHEGNNPDDDSIGDLMNN